MLDQARLALLFGDLPDLFHAEPELLRVAVLPQIKNGHDFFAAGTAGPFREQRLLGQELHPGLVVFSLRTVLVQADVPRRDASHTTIAIVQHLRRREAGVDLDAQRFGLLAQPVRESTGASSAPWRPRFRRGRFDFCTAPDQRTTCDNEAT